MFPTNIFLVLSLNCISNKNLWSELHEWFCLIKWTNTCTYKCITQFSRYNHRVQVHCSTSIGQLNPERPRVLPYVFVVSTRSELIGVVRSKPFLENILTITTKRIVIIFINSLMLGSRLRLFEALTLRVMTFSIFINPSLVIISMHLVCLIRYKE